MKTKTFLKRAGSISKDLKTLCSQFPDVPNTSPVEIDRAIVRLESIVRRIFTLTKAARRPELWDNKRLRRMIRLLTKTKQTVGHLLILFEQYAQG